MAKIRIQSKRVALEACIELWDWLAAHPSCFWKADWPQWDKYEKCSSDCHCCQYVVNHYGYINCRTCPIGKWHPDQNHYGAPCCDYAAPFYKWDEAKSPKTRKKYAKQVANLAREALTKLPKKGKP